MKNLITLSGSTQINASVETVYEKLANPHEQVKWNSLYQEVSVSPPGEVRTGTVMTGTFKGTGKASVEFRDVIKNKQFTHHNLLKMFGFDLGEFDHQYKVEDVGGKTQFTQTVTVHLRGLGKILGGVLEKNFAKRLPESFEEFRAYAEKR